MTLARDADGPQLSRDEVDRLEGPVLLEFGASWCGHCQSLAPGLARLVDEHTEVRFIWVEDGPGRPLGRSFRVKLWPTLVFLKGGKVVEQLARPSLEQARRGFEALGEA
ncbi:Thioredoxin-2 [Aquisphaera giovannonii]|uniref:Thioredoxin-2 n=1 Tax=Aquisphaera giovannonii TaxID=406548 RepID=A0A5B9VVM6_9BACT|nr:thioredoxin family protein [Aquisphaera giovannonii]QEH31987.1 Thioredoxin-2 [Aquisphaera giovannonii]